MGKLFGTDGIRGVVNAGLDAELAYRVGLCTAAVLGQEKTQARLRVAIGRDTRISGELLKGALVAGLCTAGADVLDLGVIPTPGVAWTVRQMGIDAGIVISASHNPFEYNGIKIFNRSGFKLSDSLEDEIEKLLEAGWDTIAKRTHGEMGQMLNAAAPAAKDYLDGLAKTVNTGLEGLRILVDCANGAAGATARDLFSRFPGLSAEIICDKPDGININHNCGSTHMQQLSRQVVAGGFHMGLAFDGDADRCLAVDEQGELIDGDQIMAACGLYLKGEGRLAQNTVVATVMSNLGLHVYARENGLLLECTDVGDRNVLERMLEAGYQLGGEQSGHMIFLDHSTTGDGQLTALQVLSLLKKSGKPASQVFGACRRYPQVLINIPVKDLAAKERVMESRDLARAIAEAEAVLDQDGRVLVRPSGTEALMRVMVEAKTKQQADDTAAGLAQLIKILAV